MLHKLSERIAFLIYRESDEFPIEVYVYGLELIISSILETSALLIIGYIINRLCETLTFLISFSSIRFFSGGYHSKSYLRCFFTTLICFAFIVFINSILLKIETSIILLLATIELLLSFIIFIKISPVESVGKEILNPRRQKYISIIFMCLNLIIACAGSLLMNNNMLFIVMPTIMVVDILMIIEKIKGVVKNEKSRKIMQNNSERNS